MTQSIPADSLSTTDRSLSKGSNIAAWALQILLAIAFLGAGGSKVAGAPPMVETFNKIGIGQWFRYLTGGLELAGAIALLIPRTRFYAAGLLALIMIGAVITHLTIIGGNPAPPIVLLALLVTVAYLRRP